MVDHDGDHGVVAIVDDDPAVLDSLRFLLEVAGHTVEAYASARAFLDDRTVQASCLILDQHMPTMTGLELAARLRVEGSDIPILLIAANVSPAMIARAAELDITDVLEKPLAEADLFNFIAARTVRQRMGRE